MNKLLCVARHSAMTAILLMAVLACAQANQATPPSSAVSKPGRATAQTSSAKDHPVTAVTGESWLNHLNRQFGDTSMGKTGRIGPPPPAPGDEAQRGQPGLSVACSTQSTTLHGADLYRLNCQGCHGETGQGAPPEINSVINPVRATSVPLVLERMKKVGMDMSRAEATQLAQQAQSALLERLHNGGRNMPAFPQLNEAEIRAILAYLRQLAGIPGAEHEQVAVSEPPVRVGELIVKSTCHTCHSATGPNPTAQQLLEGAIPPLETLTARKDQSGLIQKVTQGAAVSMGTPPALTRGRMPVFYYLSPEEAADVYLYLTQYPPSELSVMDNVAASIPPTQAPAQPAPGSAVANPQTGSSKAEVESPPAIRQADTPYVGWLVGLGLFMALLMTGGLGFTLWHFRRLSLRRADRMSVIPARGNSTAVRQSPAAKLGPCRSVSERGKRRRSEPLMEDIEDLATRNNRGGRKCSGTRAG